MEFYQIFFLTLMIIIVISAIGIVSYITGKESIIDKICENSNGTMVSGEHGITCIKNDCTLNVTPWEINNQKDG